MKARNIYICLFTWLRMKQTFIATFLLLFRYLTVYISEKLEILFRSLVIKSDEFECKIKVDKAVWNEVK